MKEKQEVKIDLKEATRVLAESAGIKEGLWQIGFALALGAANVRKGPDGPLLPTGLLSITGITLGRMEAEDALTVNLGGTPDAPKISLVRKEGEGQEPEEGIKEGRSVGGLCQDNGPQAT